MGVLVRFVLRLMYTFLFHIFYNMYLELLRLENCFGKCAKSKWEEQKKGGSICYINIIIKVKK